MEKGVTEKDAGAMGDEQGSASRKVDTDGRDADGKDAGVRGAGGKDASGKDAGDVGDDSVWAGESVAVKGIDNRRRQQVRRGRRAEAGYVYIWN